MDNIQEVAIIDNSKELTDYENKLKALTATAIEFFPNKEEQIKAMVSEAKKYRFDVNAMTKENYDIAYKVWQNLRNIRLETTRVGKKLRDWSNAYNKQIKGHEDKLNALVQDEEERFYEYRTAYETKLEEEKRLREEQEKARLQKRVEMLASVNYAMDIDLLKAMTDDDFDQLYQNVKEDFEQQEKDKQAEIDRMIAADKERMRKLEEENAKLRAGIPEHNKPLNNEDIKLSVPITPPSPSPEVKTTVPNFARIAFFEYIHQINDTVNAPMPQVILNSNIEPHFNKVQNEISKYLKTYLDKE